MQKTPDGRCYGRDDLYHLLKDETDPAISALFVENSTDDVVIEQATQYRPSNDSARVALHRSRQSLDFFKRYMKAAANNTTFKSQDDFLTNKVKYLNLKAFRHPSGKSWTKELLKEYV